MCKSVPFENIVWTGFQLKLILKKIQLLLPDFFQHLNEAVSQTLVLNYASQILISPHSYLLST